MMVLLVETYRSTLWTTQYNWGSTIQRVYNKEFLIGLIHKGILPGLHVQQNNAKYWRTYPKEKLPDILTALRFSFHIQQKWVAALLFCVAECHQNTNRRKKRENFQNCTLVWSSCTANFRVNISTSTAEIVLVGISVFEKNKWVVTLSTPSPQIVVLLTMVL